MAAPKPKTRAELEADLAKLRDEHGAEHRQRCAAESREKETRAQLADLKERLANAEADNQRMRGYIARVQEDDVGREELVTVGDVHGEHQLVPKRKTMVFEPPSPYGARRDTDGDALSSYIERNNRPRPRHWVTY